MNLLKYLTIFRKLDSAFINEIKYKDRKLVLKNDFILFDNIIIEYLHEKDISLNDDKENILKEISKVKFEIERSEKF